MMFPSLSEWANWSTNNHVAGDLRIHMVLTWWRYQMETFSALLAICVGNSPVPVNSPHDGQWHGALMFSLICARINSWVNNGEAVDLRCHRTHYDVTVMMWSHHNGSTHRMVKDCVDFYFDLQLWSYLSPLLMTKKKSPKLCITGPFWPGYRWIPNTKGQLCWKCVHVIR